MDVINFSGGGPQIDPANDALVEAVHDARRRRRRAGDRGRQRPRRLRPRLRRLAGHRARRDLRRRGLEHPRLRARARRDRAGAPPDAARASRSWARTASAAPAAWGTTRPAARRRRLDRRHGRQPGRAAPLRAAGDPTRPGRCRRARSTARSRSSSAASARSTTKARAGQRRGRDRDRLRRQPRGRGERPPRRSCRSRAARSRTSTARTCATTSARTAAGRRCASAASPLELETGRSGVITSFSSAGPTAFGHDLKPDLAAPGGQILSSTLPSTTRRGSPSSTGRRWRRRTSPARPRCSCSCTARWTPQQVKSALDVDRGPCLGRHGAHAGGAGHARGRRPRRAAARRRPAALHRARRRSRSRTCACSHGAAARGLLVRLTDAGDGAGTWQVAARRAGGDAGHVRSTARHRHGAARRRGRARRSSRTPRRGAPRARTTASSSCARAT